MSETAVIFIVGQALVLVGAIITASIYMARKLTHLSANQEAAEKAVDVGFQSVRMDVGRVEAGVNRMDERHEQLRVQVNGLSRRVERHNTLHEHIDRDLAELRRVAGGD